MFLTGFMLFKENCRLLYQKFLYIGHLSFSMVQQYQSQLARIKSRRFLFIGSKIISFLIILSSIILENNWFLNFFLKNLMSPNVVYSILLHIFLLIELCRKCLIKVNQMTRIWLTNWKQQFLDWWLHVNI